MKHAMEEMDQELKRIEAIFHKANDSFASYHIREAYQSLCCAYAHTDQDQRIANMMDAIWDMAETFAKEGN